MGVEQSRGRGALLVALVCALTLLAGSYGAVRLLPSLPAGQPRTPAPAHTPAASPDFGPASIFLDSQEPRFSVPLAAGEAGQPINSTQAAYTATNTNGVKVAGGAAPVTQGVATVLLPRLADGYYTLSVAPAGAAASQPTTIPFAVLAPFAPPDDSRFGVVTHFALDNPPQLVHTAQALGISQVRDDLLWNEIETRPGQYVFPTAYDAYMAELAREHVRPLIVLGYSNPLYDGGATPYDDTGMNAYVNYVRAVLRHYGGEIGAVEVFNEYNIPEFSSGPCGQKPSCYVEILHRAYRAIKAIRPDVTVVGATASEYDVPWYQQVFADGGLQYLDAVAIHPYTQDAPEAGHLAETIGALQQLIQRYNGGRPKPIWLTELGWASYAGLDEQTQAKYAARGLTLLVAAGVQRFYWYDLLSDSSDSALQNAYGLLRRPDANTAGSDAEYTPKPAFVAYAVAVRQLSGAAFQAAEPVAGNGDGSIYDERFVRGGETLRALWTTGPARSVTLAASVPLLITTMMGATRTLSPSNGRATLVLSDRPVYVLGTVGGIAASATPAAARVMPVAPASGNDNGRALDARRLARSLDALVPTLRRRRGA